MRRKQPGSRIIDRVLDEMVDDATVDSNDEADQVMGLHNMLVEHLELPFETCVLGVKVTVRSVEISVRDQIVAICLNGRHRQAVGILDLPLPTPRPAGAEWIDAYRRWAGAR